MDRILDYSDIQGNITRAYSRYSFPFARYFFLHIEHPDAGQTFVNRIRGKITTAHAWTPDTRPKVTLNIGFTYPGLVKLGVPSRTLQGMPNPFVDGMRQRAFILGDRDQTLTEDEARDEDWCKHWDPIWQTSRCGHSHTDDVHIWMSMNAQLAQIGKADPVPELETQTQWLRDVCSDLNGQVRILTTNGPKGDEEFQQASAVFRDHNGVVLPTPREHFGLTDGIGNPVFRGQYPDKEEEKRLVVGRGKWMSKEKGWEPLATGEFLMGHVDESQEIAPRAMPPEFSHNGSFMVYRKLHENVATWKGFVDSESAKFARVMGIGEEEARETLVAKMVGRWSDGVPLSRVPTYAEWQQYRHTKGMDDPDPVKALVAQQAFLRSTEASDFKFGDDMEGFKCPGGSHLRRVNTRDYLDPLNKPGSKNPDSTTQLNKRRRILRRGLPYGDPLSRDLDDNTEQGVAMMIVGTGIFRQFEFVQQQWIQYGLDFNEGNNTCPILGDHKTHKRHPIASDPATGKPTYIVNDLKTFVETRGGDYFFLPSMTCLEMIAHGSIDPT